MQATQKKMLGGVILFGVTFILLGFSVKELWFREDDLGTIVNGLIRNWNDFVRVFSSDCRSFIVPMNYRRTEPNFISGFLRPIQNVFFTGIYYFWDFNPHAYYLVHVALHAFNAMLLFYLSSCFVPVSFSLLAGFLFAFYPNVSWLTWIGTMQNSLSTLFLLLSGLVFYRFLVQTRCFIPRDDASHLLGTTGKGVNPENSHLLGTTGKGVNPENSKKITIYRLPEEPMQWASRGVSILAGLLFFLSLLSRENGLFIPFWLLLGVFLFYTDTAKNWWQRGLISLRYTMIFFVMNACYVVTRMWAFGFGTLARTYNNLFIRYPWLTQIFGNHEPVSNAVSAATTPTTPVVHTVTSVVHAQATASPTFFEKVFDILSLKIKSLISWLSNIFVVSAETWVRTSFLFFLTLFFILFLIIAYRKHKQLLFWLFVGVGCGIWPGFLAYPCARYINLAYPFLAVLLVVGMYLLTKQNSGLKQKILLGAALLFAGLATIKGAYQNSFELASAGRGAWEYNKRFEKFFQENTFDKKVKVILLGSPFVSDIQSIFQVGFNHLAMPVAFELFSTFAEKGSFGCQKDYRTRDVASQLVAIKNGYRFISEDTEHCAMWMQFSDHPIRFNQKNRAYEWTTEPYQADQWYQSSMGKFKIHEMIEGKYVTDISFVFDPGWIDENTVFVTWDTEQGKYRLIPI